MTSAEQIRAHLDQLALGGNHPLMVVVPREAVTDLLTALDALESEHVEAVKEREYWFTQHQELARQDFIRKDNA